MLSDGSGALASALASLSSSFGPLSLSVCPQFPLSLAENQAALLRAVLPFFFFFGAWLHTRCRATVLNAL
eukprot:m.286916 g.286916  ORF g.286916 m.286916 type:complete len:70 (-) comp11664_c0_seq1:15-224(-)